MRSFLLPRALMVAPALMALPLLLPGTAHAKMGIGASVALASIRVAAERTVLRADGRSTTYIVADVQDDSGHIVPDGTRVVFTLTSGQGQLDATVVATQNGVARVRLTAADSPGSALITVNLETPGGAAPSQITIQYSNDDTNNDSASNFAHIAGPNYTALAADMGQIQADGKNGTAKVEFRGTTITADSLQVEPSSLQVVAAGNVTLSRGKTKRVYRNLQYNLVALQGVGEQDDDGRPRPVQIQGVGLEESRSEAVDPATWQLKDLYGSGLLISSRAIDLEPGVRIQFRRAIFYVDGRKTISLPYYVLDANNRTAGVNQVIGYNNMGLTVDLPFYYDVRPSGVGTLHLRRGAQVGTSAYSNRPGWSLDFEQGYSGKQGTDGLLEVLGVTRSTWGARLRHNQRFAPSTTGNVFLDAPNHRDLFASTQFSHHFPGFTFTAFGNGSRRNSDDFVTGRNLVGGDLRGQLAADTDARPVAVPLLPRIPVRYSLNLSVARQNYFGDNGYPQGTVNTSTTGVRLYTPGLPLAPSLSLTQSVAFGRNWLTGGSSTVASTGSGFFARATTGLTRQFGSAGNVILTYDYQQNPNTSTFSSTRIGRHRAGINLQLQAATLWRFSVNGSQGLDSPVASLSTSLRLNPEGQHGPWGLSIRLYANKYGSYRFAEAEYALIRRIGDRDVAIFYSTTAKRFQFDLNFARF